MALTPSDAASLAGELTKWEYAEYFFTLLVVIGCVGEYAACFTNWLTRGDARRKHDLEKRSTLLLIGALALELVCLVKTNSLSGRLIGSLDEQSRQAVEDSTKALGDSSKAIKQSDKAKKEASEASTLATGAKKEADAFKADIASAKKQASEAESHLGEAVSMARAEEAELRKLEKQVAPRLFNREQLISIRDNLRAFRGHSAVRVESYGLDGEGAALATQIMSIITSATGVTPINGIAGSIVSGGFDQGIQIRGPASERMFMSAMASQFASVGGLTAVQINGATFRAGGTLSGRAAIAGGAILGGGGGPTVPPIPAAGPVIVQVGIKPIETLIFTQ